MCLEVEGPGVAGCRQAGRSVHGRRRAGPWRRLQEAAAGVGAAPVRVCVCAEEARALGGGRPRGRGRGGRRRGDAEDWRRTASQQGRGMGVGWKGRAVAVVLEPERVAVVVAVGIVRGRLEEDGRRARRAVRGGISRAVRRRGDGNGGWRGPGRHVPREIGSGCRRGRLVLATAARKGVWPSLGQRRRPFSFGSSWSGKERRRQEELGYATKRACWSSVHVVGINGRFAGMGAMATVSASVVMCFCLSGHSCSCAATCDLSAAPTPSNATWAGRRRCALARSRPRPTADAPYRWPFAAKHRRCRHRARGCHRRRLAAIADRRILPGTASARSRPPISTVSTLGRQSSCDSNRAFTDQRIAERRAAATKLHATPPGSFIFVATCPAADGHTAMAN